ncbi:restriction endonuclease subunit S [Intestinimonas butyriciproducens]|uniref:restriction endonuclease subunit S n=1 Tax=Intestinimonas butyriciproducens TaxID=1297617 RepID=UPI0031F68939
MPLGFCTYRNRSDDGRFTFNINKISDKAIVSKFYPVFRFKNANSTFMTEYLNSSARARKKLSVLAVGTSQVVLSFEALKSAKFDLPCKEEQDKIASLLECLNERVELQRSFVDALKKYKRGLLSNLFGEKITQGCTTKSYYFSEIAQRRSEKYDPSSGIEYPCVELENIEQETGKILATVPSTAQSSIKNIAMPGDTLFGKLRPYLRKYAFAKKTMACSSEIWALIPSDVVLPKFLFYLVQTEHFLRVANISSGTKMPRAEWSNIEKAEFFIPDFSVQRKVVSLLEGLDQKITFADSTLLSLNRLKASLLQHLFI